MSYGMEEWDWIQGAAFIPDVTYLPIENHRWSSADVLVVLVSVAPRACSLKSVSRFRSVVMFFKRCDIRLKRGLVAANYQY